MATKDKRLIDYLRVQALRTYEESGSSWGEVLPDCAMATVANLLSFIQDEETNDPLDDDATSLGEVSLLTLGQRLDLIDENDQWR